MDVPLAVKGHVRTRVVHRVVDVLDHAPDNVNLVAKEVVNLAANWDANPNVQTHVIQPVLIVVEIHVLIYVVKGVIVHV
jgi:hypothetical protein